MSEFDWLTLIDNLDAPISMEDRAQRIADVLVAGAPSETFCLMLAEMIRPGGKNTSPYMFKLQRTRQGQPKGPDWWLVASEMERLVDQEGLSEDAAVFRIQRDFGEKGNCKRKCQDALYAARAFTRAARALDEPPSNED